MTVRRLSRDQPPSFAFTPASEETVAFWLAKYPPAKQQSAVLPLLWIAQKQEGWVSEPAIRVVAERLAMPLIRVLEVATFYTMFHLAPVGRHVIQVCGTTPCALRGAGALMDVCREKIGPRDRVSADGAFTWQEVECMGACANAPMAAVNDYYVEDMTAADMAHVIETLAAGGEVTLGPRNGRRFSEPLGGPLTLIDESLYDGRLAEPVTLPNRPEPQPEPA